MKITVASGKGGTGKTTFSVNLAYFLAGEGKEVALLDGDVEEPNAHLFLPDQEMNEEDVTILKPSIDEDKCIACGKCVKACHYNALALVKKQIIFFNELCHACGACSYVCPTSCIEERPSPLGKVYSIEKNNDLPFFFAYGELKLGESLAPMVVKKLKTKIKDKADVYNILDASPGTACPVVEALSGDDTYAVLVTEPTPFGLNDLRLAAELAVNKGNETGIVINRSDGCDDIITNFADEHNIPILGRIPFERKYAESYSQGKVLIKKHPELRKYFKEIIKNIEKYSKEKIEYKKIDSVKYSLKSRDLSKGRNDNASEKYKELVIISGKGGTGKTTVTASLGLLLENTVVFDADVDAADLHLILKPDIIKKEKFSGSDEYLINSEKCFSCGRCEKGCHFGAISMDGPANDIVQITYRIDPLSCEGCGLCQLICPADAIYNKPAETGLLFISEINEKQLMVHAKLGVGGENSGKLVSRVRMESAEIAEKTECNAVIGDGPPGISCPVIASVTGADLILIVTEPTVSGIHDLVRVLQLIHHFGLKSMIVVNKADLNKDICKEIKITALKYNSEVIEEIPFDRNIHYALMEGKTIIEYGKGASVEIMRSLASKIEKELSYE